MRLVFPMVPAYLVVLSTCGMAYAPGPASTVWIVEDHRSAWRIVSPAPDEPGIPWAIAELQKYVEAISGARLTAADPPGEGPALVVGLRDRLSPEDRAALPPHSEGYDGYAIAIREGRPARIVIAGDNGRGTIYGVYDFLERLGCRWFYPTQDPRDPEVIPHVPSLAIPTGSWAVASPMRHRIYNGDAWFFDIDPEKAIQQVDHAMKLRCNLIGWQCAVDKPPVDQYRSLGERGVLAEIERRGLAIHGPAHSFNLFLPNDLFAAHPDWFGIRDGRRVPQQFGGAQFCWSNADARKVFAANVVPFAEQAHLIHILTIVPFDGGPACDCPECRQLGASNALMALMSEVIERLKPIRPDLLIETVGGYSPMVEPPTGAAIHPALRIAWAHWGRYMGFGYDDARYDRRKNLEAWQDAARSGMTIVQYYSDNFAEPWVLPPFAAAIRGDRRYLLGRGIDSVYFLIYPPGYWWNHSLNTYLSARCFYDSSLDPFDLIRDYATRYYGPEAGPLLAQYFDDWAREPDLGYHVRGGTTSRDRMTLARQRRDLIDPALAASKDQLPYAHRVGKIAGLHALAERLAEGHHLRHRIQLARQRGDFDEAARLLESAGATTDNIMRSFTELADRDQGLIDKNEVAGFIKLGVKGWVEAEAKAIASRERSINEVEALEDSDEAVTPRPE